MTSPFTVANTAKVLAEDEAPVQGEAVDLTVVIPAFNERQGVGQTVEQVRTVLAGKPYTSEMIVVDDGSTDDTAEQAEASGARVLRLPVNGGYGAALKAGIAGSSSEYIVIIDADGTYPAEAIPDMVAQAAGADMVVGARPTNSSNIPRIRRPAKWFLNKLGSYLAGQKIPDINSGLRVMRKSTLRRFLPLLPSGFSFTTTISLLMLCTHHKVVYWSIDYHPRVGSSKIRPADFTNFVMLVLRTIVLFNPLKIFLPLGMILFLLGLLKFIQDLFLWNLSETAVMAFLAAVIVWSVGLLADQIARISFSMRQE